MNKKIVDSTQENKNNQDLVNEKCINCINILNSLPIQELNDLRIFALKTYGNDYCSRLKKDILMEITPKADYNRVCEFLYTESDILKTLRWICRGLKTDIAIQKTITDAQMYESGFYLDFKEEYILDEINSLNVTIDDSLTNLRISVLEEIKNSKAIDVDSHKKSTTSKKINKKKDTASNNKSNKISAPTKELKIFKKENIVKGHSYWQAIEDEWKINSDKYVILDTETTGVKHEDQVIQLTIIDLKGTELFNSYFYTSQPVHWGAQKVHKISKQTINNAPLWNDKWDELKTILKNKIILAHNNIFDLRLIEQTCERNNIDIDFEVKSICTLEYSKYKYKIGKLSDVAKYLNVDFDPDALHNSLVDCNLCLHVINPENTLFSTREKASRYFEAVSSHYIKNGDKNGRIKNLQWAKKTFNLDKVNFKLMSLETCASIISALEPTVLKNKLI